MNTFRKFRDHMKLSMGEMASALDISRAHVCRIERGSRLPSADVIARMAKLAETNNAPFTASDFLQARAS